jgi:hypothetical protein
MRLFLCVPTNCMHAMTFPQHDIYGSLSRVSRFTLLSMLGLSVLISAVTGAQAQDAAGKEIISDSAKNPVTVPLEQPKRSDLLSLGLDYSWLGKAGFTDHNFSTGHLGEQTVLGNLKFRIPVTDALSFSIGASYEGFFFDLPKSIAKPALPLRSQLETVGVNLGVNYRFSDKLTVFGEVAPFIASDFVDLSSDDLGIGGSVGLRYAPYGDDRLFFLLGASVRSNSAYPVAPVAGIHWVPNDLFTFNIVFPHPEIDLHLTQRITLFANSELLGGTFRVGKNVGTNIGETRYNNALLDYQEVRVGGGVRVQVLKNLTFDAEGGETVYRNFDYFRFGQQTQPQNAPYVETSLKFWF